MPRHMTARERSAADERGFARDFIEQAFEHLGAAEALLCAEERDHAPAVSIDNQNRLVAIAETRAALMRAHGLLA